MVEKRVHLLLVEDTPAHQELMLATLAKTHPDWVLHPFWSAEPALEAARSGGFDAAVLDFTLPGMTGLDLAEELHRLTPDMPLVLVTARGSEKVAARALRAGVSEYLIKEGDYLDLLPLSIAKAIETVEAARDRERMRKELLRRTEELSALNAVATAVIGSLSLSDVLAEALGQSLSVLNAEAGAIYVVDANRRAATLEACQGIDEPSLQLMRGWRPNMTSVRRLLEGRRAFVTLAEAFRLSSPAEAAGNEDWSRLEALLALPLKAGGALMGLLCVRPKGSHGFSSNELKLLAALGRPISMAMSNARLYQQTREQLTELTASQDRLIAAARATVAQGLALGMTRDINDAMTSIKGSAQLISRERGLPRNVEQDALRVLEGCDRVLRLSTALRSMIVLPEGRRAPHSVNRTVTNCMERLKESAEAMQIVISSTLAPHLPTISIEGDVLEQTLLNIMINGVEAMPSGGQLSVATGYENDGVYVAITDTGEGIAQENLERVFEPDFTTRRDRGHVRGLGLGLFAARNLIHSRGGTISVRSELGKGSTFVVRLPANAAADGVSPGESVDWSEAGEDRLVRESGLVLNLRTRQVAVGKGHVEGLTKMEARLLEVFMTNPNTVLTREFLMKEVWETEYVGDTRTLDVHVHWLRQKVEESPSRPRLLRTMRGLGYRFGRTTDPRSRADLDLDIDFDLPNL